MEVEIGDYFAVLFKILWQGILNLLFNDLTCLKVRLFFFNLVKIKMT
jgi:hypothetical protein